MKVNAISNFNSNQVKVNSFKRTAVPYPEYTYNTLNKKAEKDAFKILSEKITEFFNPEVSAEADNIKKHINSIFDNASQPKNVLNVVA